VAPALERGIPSRAPPTGWAPCCTSRCVLMAVAGLIPALALLSPGNCVLPISSTWWAWILCPWCCCLLTLPWRLKQAWGEFQTLAGALGLVMPLRQA